MVTFLFACWLLFAHKIPLSSNKGNITCSHEVRSKLPTKTSYRFGPIVSSFNLGPVYTLAQESFAGAPSKALARLKPTFRTWSSVISFNYGFELSSMFCVHGCDKRN